MEPRDQEVITNTPFDLGHLCFRSVGLHEFKSPLDCARVFGQEKSIFSETCENNPRLMSLVAEGAKLAINFCQSEFAEEQWNCSVVDPKNTVFGDLVYRGYPETGFIQALTAAGVAHSIVGACLRGELDCGSVNDTVTNETVPENGKRKVVKICPNKTPDNKCARDPIGEGLQKAKDLINEKAIDLSAAVHKQNIEAGRQAVKDLMVKDCKCTGRMGNCSNQICWREVPPFKLVARSLVEFYKIARLVHAGPPKRHGHRKRNGHGRENEHGRVTLKGNYTTFNKSHIVYYEMSPDFCVVNPTLGSLGTDHRYCSTGIGGKNCSFCCSREYHSTTKVVEYGCNCRFTWCCNLQCETCEDEVTIAWCTSAPKSFPASIPFRDNIKNERKRVTVTG